MLCNAGTLQLEVVSAPAHSTAAQPGDASLARRRGGHGCLLCIDRPALLPPPLGPVSPRRCRARELTGRWHALRQQNHLQLHRLCRRCSRLSPCGCSRLAAHQGHKTLLGTQLKAPSRRAARTSPPLGPRQGNCKGLTRAARPRAEPIRRRPPPVPASGPPLPQDVAGSQQTRPRALHRHWHHAGPGTAPALSPMDAAQRAAGSPRS